MNNDSRYIVNTECFAIRDDVNKTYLQKCVLDVTDAHVSPIVVAALCNRHCCTNKLHLNGVPVHTHKMREYSLLCHVWRSHQNRFVAIQLQKAHDHRRFDVRLLFSIKRALALRVLARARRRVLTRTVVEIRRVRMHGVHLLCKVRRFAHCRQKRRSVVRGKVAK
jgi:hypothetical protein